MPKPIDLGRSIAAIRPIFEAADHAAALATALAAETARKGRQSLLALIRRRLASVGSSLRGGRAHQGVPQGIHPRRTPTPAATSSAPRSTPAAAAGDPADAADSPSPAARQKASRTTTRMAAAAALGLRRTAWRGSSTPR